MNVAQPRAQAQHTQGEWIALFGNPWNDDEGDRKLVMTADRKRTIAHVFNAGDPDEQDANADLIAAAPKMLAALREASALMPLGTKCRAEWLARAGSAIAKAEGRT